MGKNPQKAPQHHCMRKLQPTYKPLLLSMYKNNPKYRYRNSMSQKCRNLQLKICHRECFSRISRGRRFHSPTILFIKLNLNKLVPEWLVKMFRVSILLNAYPLSVNIPREPNPRTDQGSSEYDH